MTGFTGRTRIVGDGRTYAVECEYVEPRWFRADQTWWVPLTQDSRGNPKPVSFRTVKLYSEKYYSPHRFDKKSRARKAAHQFRDHLAQDQDRSRDHGEDKVIESDVTSRLTL